MLDVGMRTGDLTRVFPACRQLLADARSRTQGAESYLLLIHAFLLPVVPVVFLLLMVWVIPKYQAIALDMGAEPPLLFCLMVDGGIGLVLLAILVSLLLFGLVISYMAGPQADGRLKRLWHCWDDRWVTWLPWRWKRLQRDFSSLLSLLLDASLPEAEAVSLAAQSTANTQFEKRAQQTIKGLQQGIPLTQAIQSLDRSGELHWRIANAVHQKGGFTRALQGWHAALDAKAFQLEQAAAHVATTAMVLLNGVLVALVVFGIFSLLISIINQQVLW
jgi:type II secretory pathway component PulF